MPIKLALKAATQYGFNRPRVAWAARAVGGLLFCNPNRPVLFADSVGLAAVNQLRKHEKIVNAAIGGSGIEHFVTIAELARRQRERLLIVALGVNNCRFGQSDIDGTMEGHARVVGDSPAVIVGIWPTEATGFVYRYGFDNTAIAALNERLRAFAAEPNRVFVEPPPVARLTIDGIHLNGSGQAVWAERAIEGLAELRARLAQQRDDQKP